MSFRNKIEDWDLMKNYEIPTNPCDDSGTLSEDSEIAEYMVNGSMDEFVHITRTTGFKYIMPSSINKTLKSDSVVIENESKIDDELSHVALSRKGQTVNKDEYECIYITAYSYNSDLLPDAWL